MAESDVSPDQPAETPPQHQGDVHRRQPSVPRQRTRCQFYVRSKGDRAGAKVLGCGEFHAISPSIINARASSDPRA